jgi:hypothetical protein
MSSISSDDAIRNSLIDPKWCFSPSSDKNGESEQSKLMHSIAKLREEGIKGCAGCFSVWKTISPNQFNIHYVAENTGGDRASKAYTQQWEPILIQNGKIHMLYQELAFASFQDLRLYLGLDQPFVKVT